MKKLLTALVLLTSLQAFAAPPIKDGFSGFFDLGFIYTYSNDSMKPSNNSEDIDSTDSNVDYYNNKRLVALFDLRYREADHVYHIGSPMHEAERGFLAGVTFLNGRSSIDVSAVISPFSKEWEDPYALNRDTTDKTSYGMRIKADGIASTPFGLEVRATTTDIDNDVSGETYETMKRDGETYLIRGTYKIPAGEGRAFIPMVEYTREDREGEAQSGDEYTLGLRYMYKKDKLMLMPAIKISTMTYDADDAVFEKEREDVGAGIMLISKYDTPFEIPHTHISFILGVRENESTIDFYDYTSVMTGLMFGVHF